MWTSRSSTSTRTCSNACGAKLRRNTSWTCFAAFAPAFPASRCEPRSSSVFPARPPRNFEALLDFIRAAKFERLGVFAYSQEAGTRAGNMAGQIPDRVKAQRRALAMAAQHEVAVQVAESFVGRTIKVLVEQEATATELKNARISRGNTA